MCSFYKIMSETNKLFSSCPKNQFKLFSEVESSHQCILTGVAAADYVSTSSSLTLPHPCQKLLFKQ